MPPATRRARCRARSDDTSAVDVRRTRRRRRSNRPVDPGPADVPARQARVETLEERPCPETDEVLPGEPGRFARPPARSGRARSPCRSRSGSRPRRCRARATFGARRGRARSRRPSCPPGPRPRRAARSDGPRPPVRGTRWRRAARDPPGHLPCRRSRSHLERLDRSRPVRRRPGYPPRGSRSTARPRTRPSAKAALARVSIIIDTVPGSVSSARRTSSSRSPSSTDSPRLTRMIRALLSRARRSSRSRSSASPSSSSASEASQSPVRNPVYPMLLMNPSVRARCPRRRPRGRPSR